MELDIFHELSSANLANEDRVAAAIWVQHWTKGDLGQVDMVHRLAIIRKNNYAGYRWLVDNHNEAAAIKVRLRWHDREDDAINWPDEASVMASVREVRGLLKVSPTYAEACLTMLRTGVERFSPQFLHLVPGSFKSAAGKDSGIGMAGKSTLPPPPAVTAVPVAPVVPPPFDPIATFTAKHGRPPGSLTPEALKAARMNNPASRGLVPDLDAEPDAPPPEPEPGGDFASAAADHARSVNGSAKQRPAMPWDDPPS